MNEHEKNVIIIGNGPAGISASLYTARAGIKTMIIGKGQGSLAKAEKIENYYGLEAPISGAELIERGIRQAEKLGVEIIQDEVVGISFADLEASASDRQTADSLNADCSGSDIPITEGSNAGSLTADYSIAECSNADCSISSFYQSDLSDNPNARFVVKTKSANYTASAVLIATGTARTAPPVKGLRELEGQGVSYCAVCDAFFYRGKDVAVLGSGEYALHELQELAAVAGSVTLLTNGEEPTVEFPQGTTIRKEKIASFNAGPVNPLFGTAGPLASVTFETGEEMPIAGVFVAYGVAGSTALAKKVGAFTDGNRISVNQDMSTNIEGLFAAGDCTGGLLQVSKAVYDGAMAATSAIKYLRK